MPKKETTINEVLEAVHQLATHMDARFNQVDERFAQIDARFEDVDARFEMIDRRFISMDKRFDRLEGRVGTIEGRVGEISASMVTKDYLDEKMSDFRDDVVMMVRKEDIKCDTLVRILRERDVLTAEDVKKLSAMEPFV